MAILSKRYSLQFHLPSDIATEVLSRLPVKSILRFRSVSKTWLSLIDNPIFAKLQFARATNNADLDSGFILLHNFRNEAYIIESESINPNSGSLKSTELNLCFASNGNSRISCSANGLLAISFKDRGCINTYVTNPVVQDFVRLPDIDLPPCWFIPYSTGFGYDSSTGLYKVVHVLPLEVGHSFSAKYELHVFTLGSSSWRVLENAHSIICPSVGRSSIVSVSSYLLHWLTLFDNYIATFDLRSESFGTIPYPQFDSPNDRGYLQILNLKGTLSIASHPSLKDHILLWIRKDESWIKHIIHKGLYCRCNISLVSFHKNGELLLVNKDSSSLLSYNIDSGKYFQIDGLPLKAKYENFYLEYDIQPYVGNLLSLETVFKEKKSLVKRHEQNN